jgi:tetratricopeptide (TPR) repeat protein
MYIKLAVKNALLSLFVVAVIINHAIAVSGSYSSDFDILPIKKMLQQEKFLEAIDELHYELDADPDNADLLSLLGYSYRKTQNYEDALTFYKWALKAKPDHRGANEYLGELYLETGQLEKAEQQLVFLSQICSAKCDEYNLLKKAIDTHKQQADH